METLKITRADVKDGKYVQGVVDFQGNVEIEEGLGYVFFSSLKALGWIVAGRGAGIEAGWGIEAGEGIKAGANISVKLRIFAGLIMWRKPKSSEELEVRCRKLESGEVAYGTLIETGEKDGQ